ncbi:MAG: hypothetical protein EOM15_09725 [Spirochaetia bacterium]|nr:hypothetical protein [Spirochaetia bacterium]
MGRKKLTIKSVCKHTHFTWGERLTLQYHYTGTNKYQKILSPTLLGRLLSKNERTIRRELKRGMVQHELGAEPFERWDYNTVSPRIFSFYGNLLFGVYDQNVITYLCIWDIKGCSHEPFIEKPNPSAV